MSRKARNSRTTFDDLRDVPMLVVPMSGQLSENRQYAALQILAAMRVAEANHRPTYPKPVEMLTPGDVIVSRDERNHETRTPVRNVDTRTCRNHVHINDRACYDTEYPVEVLRVR